MINLYPIEGSSNFDEYLFRKMHPDRLNLVNYAKFFPRHDLKKRLVALAVADALRYSTSKLSGHNKSSNSNTSSSSPSVSPESIITKPLQTTTTSATSSTSTPAATSTSPTVPAQGIPSSSTPTDLIARSSDQTTKTTEKTSLESSTEGTNNGVEKPDATTAGSVTLDPNIKNSISFGNDNNKDPAVVQPGTLLSTNKSSLTENDDNVSITNATRKRRDQQARRSDEHHNESFKSQLPGGIVRREEQLYTNNVEEKAEVMPGNSRRIREERDVGVEAGVTVGPANSVNPITSGRGIAPDLEQDGNIPGELR